MSEQQLVSCDLATTNEGCGGGMMDVAFHYLIDHGICTEDSYPYVSEEGEMPECRESSCTMDSFRIQSYVNVVGVNNLSNALKTRPISVCIEAFTWFLYESGIFDWCAADHDHGVLLVG